MTAVHLSVPSRIRPGRIHSVEFDAAACHLITASAGDRLDVAYQRGSGLTLDVRRCATTGAVLRVHGTGAGLSVDSNTPPFAIAAVLLALRDATGTRPRCLFPWPQHHRRTVMFGLTGTPALVREVLLRNEPDPRLRPVIQIGD
jgi:hypothetical protein